MNTQCERYQRELAAYLYGELPDEMSRAMEAHLHTCPGCRREMNDMKKVFNGADTLNPDMSAAMEKVDWEGLPDRIADRVLGRGPRATVQGLTGFWKALLQPRMRPVYAALFMGVLLGAVLTLLVLRTSEPLDLASREWVISTGALESMDIEVARRTTLDYLERSQYLLLDLVQSSPEKAADFWQSEYGSQQAKDLLSKKRYIDQQLGSYQISKAKVLCDQIELLFLELSQISQKLSAAELVKLQTLIQERQLVMKIKLVKKELQESEV
ncbi:MAG: anti-sigma factor [Candidatus Aminicenantaceae bacterium]